MAGNGGDGGSLDIAIAPPPDVYLRLLDELGRPRPDVAAVERIISAEPVVADAVIGLANSAFFGLYRDVSTLRRAAQLIGVECLQYVCLAAGFFLSSQQDRFEAFRADALLHHCVATGALARIIVKSETRDRSVMEYAFAAGALHDIGKVIFAEQVPERYAEVIMAAGERDMPLWEAERRYFGVSHAEAGARVLGAWSMPEPVVAAVAYHHSPSEASAGEFSPLTAVHAANVLEHQEHADLTEGIARAVDARYFASLDMSDRLAKWSEITHVLARGEEREEEED